LEKNAIFILYALPLPKQKFPVSYAAMQQCRQEYERRDTIRRDIANDLPTIIYGMAIPPDCQHCCAPSIGRRCNAPKKRSPRQATCAQHNVHEKHHGDAWGKRSSDPFSVRNWMFFIQQRIKPPVPAVFQ
jgi:hypothetical protein